MESWCLKEKCSSPRSQYRIFFLRLHCKCMGTPYKFFLLWSNYLTEPIGANILLPLFRDIWVKEQFPTDWKEGLIVKIPKKGDTSDCNNWRGINLLCLVSKVFNRVILDRLLVKVDSTLRNEQAGFRPNRSCVDQINTIRIIVEQSLEWQSPLYLLFVDYEKAFDSLSRESIWRALRNRGGPEKIVNLIKEGYNHNKCRILHDGQLSEPFETVSGVRQGCLLSPLLFLIVIDNVLRSTMSRGFRGAN